MLKQGETMEIYEEIEGHCEVCGKKMKIVRKVGSKTEGLVCQQCGQGDTGGGSEDD